MTATASVTQPSDPYLNAVVGFTRWASGSITYSFPATAVLYEIPYGGSNEPLNNFGAFTTTQQNAARSALAQFSVIANVSFSELTLLNAPNATIRMALSDAPSTAWAYLPSTTNLGGDVWFNKSSGAYNLPAVGNYAYATFVHELGHAMGLTHGHENGMPADRDSIEFTVMTYRSYVGGPTTGYTNETWGFPQTLMMYDIAAIQYMYGPNWTTNSGNTTYSWSPATGQMFVNGAGQAAPGANRIFMTLWDGGGTDTYDFSNYATNLSVDLRPGGWTTTSAAQLALLHYNGSQVARGNIANALQYNGDTRSLIENAVGGSGNDTIVGNAAANGLYGNGGDDRLYGLQGNDTLNGGSGNDTAFYQGAFSSYTFSLLSGGDIRVLDGVANRDGSDILQLIEFVTFTDLTVPVAALPLYPTIAEPAGWSVQTVGYFNRDGYSDFFWRNTADQVAVWTMVEGQMSGGSILGPIVTGWRIVGTGDFNRDGVTDLLWRSNWNAVGTWQMSNGVIGSTVDLSPNVGGWQVAGTGDFNGDGTTDILWRSETGGMGTWLMSNGRLAQLVYLPDSSGWSVVGTGDFNHDGTTDILWRSPTGAIGTWQMAGGQLQTVRYLNSNVTGWTVVGTGDFNNDGTTDILWRNDTSNLLGVWDMANGVMAGTHDVGTTLWTVLATGDFIGTGADDILLTYQDMLMIWPSGSSAQAAQAPDLYSSDFA